MRAATVGESNRRRGYDPRQPRVPKGHSDGGQWSDDDRWVGLKFVARERTSIGPRGGFTIALEIARRLLDAFDGKAGSSSYLGIDVAR